MLASVVQIGDSRGIKLPPSILHELSIEDEQGWSKAFAEMAEAEADALLPPDTIDSTAFEWVW